MTQRSNLTRLLALPATLCSAALLSAPTLNAHHGTSAHFDHDKDVTVEGVVTEMKFVNPHSYLYFEVAGENGQSVPWRCEMVEAGTLRRAGLTTEILAPGTVVKVYGKPARREDAVCYLETITLIDGTTISHRGQISESDKSFTPSAASLAITPTSSSADTIILAEGGSEAANRTIVDVPTEGMFGHWADGTRYALNRQNRVQRQGQGQNQRQGQGQRQAQTQRQGQGMAAGRTTPRNPVPAYNEAGQAIAERYDANFDNPALACSASILFGIGHHALPNEFVQISDKELRLTYGYMDMVREIYIDGEFPDSITPSVSGYSIGKWDEDTLVVTTKGFAPGVLWAFSGGGNGMSTINSNQLEVVERFTHDPSTDMLNLKWRATDPAYWTAPLSGERNMTRSTPYAVYGCLELAGENNLRSNGESLFGAQKVSATPHIGQTTTSSSSPTERSGRFGFAIIAAFLLLGVAMFGLLLYRKPNSQD